MSSDLGDMSERRLSQPSVQFGVDRLGGLVAALGDPSGLGKASRYEPLSVLGKRSGRTTVLAQDTETGQKVVIKLLSFGDDFTWDDLKLFEREAETLRSLSHPAIPQYLDYFDLETPTSKGFALVQTYIEAKSLGEQFQAGRTFNEADIQQITKQLLGILDYLHRRQPAVIHRDIKPSNILLGDRSAHSAGQVYLVDFGSVQTFAAREGCTVTVVGTYGYMPPEQFGGRAVPASDLYALGATLIYLASGRHPADLPQKDLRIQFEAFVQLSPSMIDWLRRLTEPSLERRCESVREAIAVQKSFMTQTIEAEKRLPKQPTQPNMNCLKPLYYRKPLESRIEPIYNASTGALITLKIPRNSIKLAMYDRQSRGILIADNLILTILVFAFVFAVFSLLLIGLFFMPFLTLFIPILALILGLINLKPSLRKIDIKSIVMREELIKLEFCDGLSYEFERDSARFISQTDCLSLMIDSEELMFVGNRPDLIFLEEVLRHELDLRMNL